MPFSSEQQSKLVEAFAKIDAEAQVYESIMNGVLGNPPHKAVYVRYLERVKKEYGNAWSGWDVALREILGYQPFVDTITALAAIPLQNDGKSKPVEDALAFESRRLGFENHRAVRRYMRREDGAPPEPAIPDGLVEARQAVIERGRQAEQMRQWVLTEPGDPRAAHYADYVRHEIDLLGINSIGQLISLDQVLAPREWWRAVRDVATTDAITPWFQAWMNRLAAHLGARDQDEASAWVAEFKAWSGRDE